MPQVSLSNLVASVRAGEALISFPTDTVPALAARPDRAELLFVAKQRSLDKPLILMAGQSADLWQYVAGTDAEVAHWQRVAARYWPGALTLVLPASGQVPPTVNPTDPTTIGLRVPNHALAQVILRQTGVLATTSANRSGQPTLFTQAEIEQAFPQVLTLQPSEIQSFSQSGSPNSPSIVVTSGTPSTVMRWSPQGWEILRQGAVVFED
jgi:L-threonylcarbamoyladenylate synthase